MKSYRYTIESIGGVVTTATSTEKIDKLDFDVHTLNINNTDGRTFINMEHVIRIIEEEVEV